MLTTRDITLTAGRCAPTRAWAVGCLASGRRGRRLLHHVSGRHLCAVLVERVHCALHVALLADTLAVVVAVHAGWGGAVIVRVIGAALGGKIPAIHI